MSAQCLKRESLSSDQLQQQLHDTIVKFTLCSTASDIKLLNISFSIMILGGSDVDN